MKSKVDFAWLSFIHFYGGSALAIQTNTPVCVISVNPRHSYLRLFHTSASAEAAVSAEAAAAADKKRPRKGQEMFSASVLVL